MKNQDDIFFKKEADAWYARNAHVLAPEARRSDLEQRLVRKHRLHPRRVLEVGAANGWRLESMRRKRPGARYTGVEPSAAAVREGKKVFPKLKLLRGVASALPVKNVFDLVLVVFVLHWVSREKLLASVAEIDRTVAEGGYLLCSDFLPRVPRKNRYHHRPGLYTWKTDYGALFESSGNYRPVERVITDYRTGERATPRTPEDFRAATTLYQKKTGIGYKEGAYQNKK